MLRGSANDWPITLNTFLGGRTNQRRINSNYGRDGKMYESWTKDITYEMNTSRYECVKIR